MICAANQAGKVMGGNQVLKRVSFEISSGDRVGLTGPNGCGKTTLLRLLAGAETVDEGEIFIGKGAQVGYLEQIPDADPEATVSDVLRVPFRDVFRLEEKMERLTEQMADPDLGEAELERVLQRYQSCREEFEERGGYEVEAKIRRVAHGLNLSEEMLARPFGQLSGGEKTKVGLARILLMEPDLLLLDEPTNHLDLTAMEWLEEYLSSYRGRC